MKWTKLVKANEDLGVKEELQEILNKINNEQDLFMSEVVYLQEHKEDIKRLFPNEPQLWQAADIDEEEWNNHQASKQVKVKKEASYGGYSAFDGTEEQQLFDLMIEHGIITEDEFSLVTDGWGYNLETAETVLYVRTSLRSLEQLKDDLGIKEEVKEVEENDEDYIGNEL